MKLELRQLQAFLVVASELHFGRAAKRLFISQPPLTQLIQRLEMHVGTPLFERTTRSVRLTPAGEVFQRQIGRAFNTIDSAVGAARRAAMGEVGMLEVGFAATAAYTLLPGIMEEFRARFPDLGLRLHERTSPELLWQLASGEIDVALLRPEPAPPNVELTPVAEEPLCVALPIGHPLAAMRAIPIAQLSDLPYVGFSQSRYLDRLIRQLAESENVLLNITQESELPTILTLVAAHIGVAIVPTSAEGMRSAGVAYRPLRITGKRRVPRAMLMVAHVRGAQNSAVENFVKIAQQTAQHSGLAVMRRKVT